MVLLLTISTIAIAMLTLPVGKLYMETQQKRNNPRFADPKFTHRYLTLLKTITACSAFAVLYLLYFKL